MQKIWSALIIFILAFMLALFVISFAFPINSSAGGVYIDFAKPGPEDENMAFWAFAREFALEMQKVKSEIFLMQDYHVNVYLGNMPDENGQTKSMIGLFVGSNKETIYRVRFDELYSEKRIKEKGKEAAKHIFEYLKTIEERKKKSIKIPV